jgi:hypothetical protein
LPDLLTGRRRGWFSLRKLAHPEALSGALSPRSPASVRSCARRCRRSCAPCDFPMGRALTDDLRWRIVYAIWWDGLDFADTARKFTSGPMVVSRQVVNAIWILFVETGDVASHQGRRSAPPANQIMDIHADKASHKQGQSPATRPAASGIKAARAPHGGGRRRRARRAARRQRDAAAAASWAVQQPLSSQGSLTAVSAFQSNWWRGVGFPLGPVNHGRLLDGSAGL